MQFCISKTAVNRILGRSKTTFPLKEKLTYSSWLVCPTRASEYGTPVRVATPDPSDAKGSFRAMRKVRSERCERFVPSYARGSFRAIRKVRAERYERFVPSDARGSFRAMREVRSGRCERLVPSDTRGSSRAEGSIPFICRERVAAIRAVLAHFQICEPKSAYKRVCRKADSS